MQDTAAAPQPMGELRAGNLEVRLADSTADIEAAQRLRYAVFYEEMQARPTADMRAARRDFDAFDELCDHLLVIDHDQRGAEAVVGTYRLIRREAAQKRGEFYSQSEYDIAPILEYPGGILELGRSCVAPAHRSRSTMNLLWRGIAEYVVQHGIELMFGCASLPGTDPQSLALPLSFLYYYNLAPPALRPRALAERYVDMRLLGAREINPKQALAELPPLIKGYLRLGGFIGDGAVIDEQFNTVDVAIIVKTDLIADKYAKHYSRVVPGARESGLVAQTGGDGPQGLRGFGEARKEQFEAREARGEDQ
jgi:putative hemolysin